MQLIKYLIFISSMILNSQLSAQKSLEQLLSLPDQARYDSLELRYFTHWREVDSSEVFKEISIIKLHSKNTKDEILSLYADYSEIRYLAIENPEKRPQMYETLLDIQNKLANQSQNAIVRQFIADIEHNLGLVLLDFNKDSKDVIEHLL